MTPAIEFTSVPGWAVTPSWAPADLSGRYWTVVAFAGGESIATDWVAQIATRHPEATPSVHLVPDVEAATTAVDADTATALVGWRLMMAGPAHACLRLRAHAFGIGIADDEITVATVDVAGKDVHCAHCRSVTHGAVPLGAVVECRGCGRRLAVKAHVSRRIGAHLGVLA